jgi:hypothetical protein
LDWRNFDDFSIVGTLAIAIATWCPGEWEIIELRPAMLENPCVKAMLENHLVKAMLENPCVKAMLENPCVKAMLENPCVKAMLENPRVRSRQCR